MLCLPSPSARTSCTLHLLQGVLAAHPLISLPRASRQTHLMPSPELFMRGLACASHLAHAVCRPVRPAGLLIGQEDSEELRCRVLVDALNEPAAMQAQADMYLRRSLLGLELLHLLERRAAAGAAAEREAHGGDGNGVPTAEQLELYARWDTLDHSWQTEPAAKLAQQLAQVRSLQCGMWPAAWPC